MAGTVHAPPSARSASMLARGEPGSIVACVAHCAFRSMLVAVGLRAVGHGEKDLVRDAVAGAIAIEVFLVGWAIRQERKE